MYRKMKQKPIKPSEFLKKQKKVGRMNWQDIEFKIFNKIYEELDKNFISIEKIKQLKKKALGKKINVFLPGGAIPDEETIVFYLKDFEEILK